MAPAAVPETAEDASTVEVMANSLVASPEPTILAMQLVAEVILPVQLPIPTDDNPTAAIPPLQDAQAVQMATNTLGSSVVPTEWTVKVVSLVQMPVGSDMAPVTMPEAAQNAAAVQVMANALVFAPEPAVLAMQLVSVSVSAPQLPVRALHNPAGTSPTPQDTLAVLVVANPPESTPAPAWPLVEMIAPPESPV